MKINHCLNATLILFLSTACPSFAQVALDDSGFAPEANKPVESLAVGDWGMGTNTLATPEALAARIAVAAELAVATNAGPSISKAPRVQSASSGSPPPPARWVAGADGGFTTENTSFQAMLAGTLNVEGALTVAIPDGEPGTYLRGTILVLAYCEPGELGRSVTIATSKPVQGQLLDPTRVIFKGAFAGEGDLAVVADVVYELTAYSLAQDVVIRGRLPGPEYYGLSSESELTVVSEFYTPPAPLQRVGITGEPDVLQWGRMGMIRGKAFGLGEEPDSSLSVRKTWTQAAGRSLLLESLPFSRIRNRMEALPVLESLPSDETPPTGPEGEGGSLGPLQQDDTLLAGHADLFRSLPSLRVPASACPLALAVNSYDWSALDTPGFVIDYVLTWPQPIISINFAGVVKTGFAAVGQSGSDSWNQYSFANNGTLQNLHWSDSAGNNSGASVTVANASGNWNFTCCMASIDNMYDGYVYQSGSAMTVTVNSLPAGIYHFYIYGHGPAQNANTIFSFGTTNLSTSATDPYWNTALWTNGLQYVVFSNITVTAGQQVSFSAAPGVSGYALLNGMQIALLNTLPPPPTITSQPQSVTVGQGGAVCFSVSATGTAPLTYQWRKGGVNISGATASTYTIVGVQPADAGSYSVNVSNPGGTTTSGSALLTVTGAACLTPPTGLMGWWPGDSNPTDLARSHAVTLAGGAGYAQATVGPGFSLNGTTAYAVVPSASSAGDLNVGTSSAGFSVEAWIKPSDTTYRPICEWCNSSTYGVEFWANYPGAGYLYANILDTGGFSHSISASGVLTVNTLTHVAVTYDKSAGGVARLFVNGVKRAESTLGLFTPQTSVDFYLGYRALGLSWGGMCFSGLIDEPSVYNRPLSQSEVNTIFAAGTSGKCKTPPPTPPTITTQPQGQTVTAWSGATFTVGVNGSTPINYQWKFNGTDIPGATGSSYTRQHAEPSHAGSYSVYVSNSAGNATSSGATLTVNEVNTDADSLPDWWEMKYFGTLSRDGSGDYDEDLVPDATEHADGTDPNGIEFTTSYANKRINGTTAFGSIHRLKGYPAQMLIIIDPGTPPELVYEGWVTYSENFTATLPATEGAHEVWVGLRGLSSDSDQSWDATTIVRDTTPPAITITGPTASTTTQPMTQVKGNASEPLSAITFSVNGAPETAAVVTDRHYNEELHTFTTTYFQCFDVDLVTGPNTIHVRAVDLAGNSTDHNLSITLNSDAVSPQITSMWPPDNSSLCGQTFTIDGILDDPTASISAVVIDPTTEYMETYVGMVERDGHFWIEDVPVVSAVNSLTITAVDAWKNSLVLTPPLTQSALSLAVGPVDDDELHKEVTTVSGTVSDSTHTVRVNGVLAAVTGTSWRAENVPVNLGSTAIFAAVAYPAGHDLDPTAANSARATPTKKPRLYVERDYQQLEKTTDVEAVYLSAPSGDQVHWITSHDFLKWGHNWEDKKASRGWWAFDQTDDSDKTGPLANHCNGSVSWPATEWPTLLGATPVINSECIQPRYPETAPRVGFEHCEVKDRKSGAFFYQIWEFSDPYLGLWEIGNWTQPYARTAQTTMKLYTGGKSVPHRQSVFRVSILAWEILDKRALPPFENAPLLEIPASEIIAGDLGPIGNNGLLYINLPEGATRDVTPRTERKFYKFLIVAPKHELIARCVATIPKNRERTTIGVGEEVNFSFDEALPANTIPTWTTTAGGFPTMQAVQAQSVKFTAPSNPGPATVTVTIPNAGSPPVSISTPFTVVRPTGIDHADLLNSVPYAVGFSGAGMHLRVYMAPTTVSFYRVQCMEVGRDATGISGYYTQWSPAYLGHTSARGANVPFDILMDNSWKEPWDTAHWGGDAQPWMAGGSFTWPIPGKWKVFASPWQDIPNEWNQEFTLDASGTMTVRKFGHTATRTVNGIYTKLK